ncbi:MAG: hypothetical protein IT361_04340 [Gemmatimonadaceae bacterium]|nr:hypothetical protein [Gemmatimonadaceae bacterium]
MRSLSTVLNATIAGRLLAGVLLLAPATLCAQLGSGDGFLFRVPSVRLAFTAGFAQPRARSDVFEFVTDELTLRRGDFAGGAFSAAASVRVTPRVEAGLAVSYSGRSADSESRRFEGEDDLPILQTTSLHRTALMATGRISLTSPGHSVGRFAWIPSRLVPYVGGGAGPVWYRWSQEGEFVDTETLDIFADKFISKGWALGGTAFGGTDISLTPRVGMSVEGRYLWARAPLRDDFSTFNKIDLSGYDASIGFFFRF